jgi:hypothetical protein
MARSVEEAKRNYQDSTWAGTILQGAFGWTWRSADASWEALETDAFAAFASFSCPLDRRRVQGVVQLRYDDDLDSSGKTTSVGARLLGGRNDLHGTLEWSLRHSKEGAGSWVDEQQVTAGVEVKFAEGTWIELAIGGTIPEDDDERSEFLSFGGLKYAVHGKSEYEQLRDRAAAKVR